MVRRSSNCWPSMKEPVMLRTLLNDEDRALILQRLQRVRSDAKPGWGSLDAPRMRCHVADQMRVALGDVTSKPVHAFASRTLVKFLVVNTGLKPPRGKIKTAPEMLASEPTAWEADLAAHQPESVDPERAATAKVL